MKHPDFGRPEAAQDVRDAVAMIRMRVSDGKEAKASQGREGRLQKGDHGVHSGRGETVDPPDTPVREFQDDRLAIARAKNMNAKAGGHAHRSDLELVTVAGVNRP